MEDLRKKYSTRIDRVYNNEYGFNLIRIFASLFNFSIFSLQIFRIFCHIIYINLIPLGRYTIAGSEMISKIVLFAAMTNYALFEFMKMITIGGSINSVK
jgi:hypothetical protein